MRLFAPFFAALTVFVIPSIATADGSVWVAGHLANLTTLRQGGVLGPGAQLGADLELSQFFALTVDAAASHHFANEAEEIPPDRVLSGSLGLRYNFDVFKYVPYAGIAGTGYLDTPLTAMPSTRANAGGKLFLGVDWRFHRYWSTGFRGELHALLTAVDTFPVYTLVGFRVAYHFRL